MKCLFRLLLMLSLVTSAYADGINIPPSAVGTSLPGQVQGTATNDNASTGKVGEYVTAQLLRASATTLVSSTSKTITSISLTAGDWDVTGNIGILVGATTVTTQLLGSLSLTNNAFSSFDAPVTSFPTIPANSTDLIMPIFPFRVSIASTTTVYLIGNVAFTSTAPTAYGTIQARRVR